MNNKDMPMNIEITKNCWGELYPINGNPLVLKSDIAKYTNTEQFIEKLRSMKTVGNIGPKTIFLDDVIKLLKEEA